MVELTEERLRGDVAVRIHFRTLRLPIEAKTDASAIHAALREITGPSRTVFQQHGIHLQPLSYSYLEHPELRVIEAAEPEPSEDQRQLLRAFLDSFAPSPGEVAVFLVDSIFMQGSPIPGCAIEVDEQPCAFVSQHATKWTFGHEIGHLLGLAHETVDSSRLMFGNTASIDAVPRAVLVWDELLRIRTSSLAHVDP